MKKRSSVLCHNNLTINCLLVTSTTHEYVTIQIQKQIPAHITYIEISFHLSLLGPSETIWFWRDAGTTVVERYALVLQIK